MTRILYVMGVSGSGKSTIGKLLAEKLAIPFFDGDDFHPQANIDKMREGIPLTDEDRIGWLERLHELAEEHNEQGAVIVCSALKKAYRTILLDRIEKTSKFIYLKGSFEQITNRLNQRQNHFMPTGLLKSQFNTLEEPTEAITISIDQTPNEIVNEIISRIN